MERTLISWNIPNWITIGLMAMGWFFALAAIKRWVIPGGPNQAGSGAGGF